METKNNSQAEKSRNIGNTHFRKREFFEALLHYNHSLCVAENGNESLGIAYANRSAVYLEVNQFDLCLENIQRARDSNYPKEKIEKLNKREEECKKQMKTQKPNPDDDPFKYFKLSYPPNPKYPQIVDCLEVNLNKNIVTTRDLKTGDIIAIEDPISVKVNDIASLHRCNFCIKDNLMNLIPCPGCAIGNVFYRLEKLT